MRKLTLAISKDLHRRLKRHPEIEWGEVARRVLTEQVRDLDLMDRLLAGSSLTPKDVAELDHIMKEAVLRRYRKGTEG